jgi:predicted transcriptional regulator
MRERIFNYIKDFGSITTFEAFTELGCTRLSEYIRQLRLEHNIKDTWITSTNRYGEKVQFKKYWLEEGD